MSLMGQGGLLAAFLLFTPLGVLAHGDDVPKHGGIMGRGDDTVTVEFVHVGGALTVYVEEHDTGVPILSEKLKGAFLGMYGVGRLPQQASLVPAGANRLLAEGIAPRVGDRLSVLLMLPDGMQTWSIVTWREPRPVIQSQAADGSSFDW